MVRKNIPSFPLLSPLPKKWLLHSDKCFPTINILLHKMKKSLGVRWTNKYVYTGEINTLRKGKILDLEGMYVSLLPFGFVYFLSSGKPANGRDVSGPCFHWTIMHSLLYISWQIKLSSIYIWYSYIPDFPVFVLKHRHARTWRKWNSYLVPTVPLWLLHTTQVKLCHVWI